MKLSGGRSNFIKLIQSHRLSRSRRPHGRPTCPASPGKRAPTFPFCRTRKSLFKRTPPFSKKKKKKIKNSSNRRRLVGGGRESSAPPHRLCDKSSQTSQISFEAVMCTSRVIRVRFLLSWVKAGTRRRALSEFACPTRLQRGAQRRRRRRRKATLSEVLQTQCKCGLAPPVAPLPCLFRYVSQAGRREETVAAASGTRLPLAGLNRPCLRAPVTGNLTQITGDGADHM